MGQGLAYLDEVVSQLETTVVLIQLGSGIAEVLGSGLNRLGIELHFICLLAI